MRVMAGCGRVWKCRERCGRELLEKGWGIARCGEVGRSVTRCEGVFRVLEGDGGI